LARAFGNADWGAFVEGTVGEAVRLLQFSTIPPWSYAAFEAS